LIRTINALLHAVGLDASLIGTLLLSLSTIAGTEISNPSWVNFQSAGWVSFQSAPTIVAHLKQKKMDVICYEAVADAIVNSAQCRGRAADLFSALAQTCAAVPNRHFAQGDDGAWVFYE